MTCDSCPPAWASGTYKHPLPRGDSRFVRPATVSADKRTLTQSVTLEGIVLGYEARLMEDAEELLLGLDFHDPLVSVNCSLGNVQLVFACIEYLARG